MSGTIYLLHFDKPVGPPGAPRGHLAQHYTGWTDDLQARLAAHGKGRGARLVAVVAQQGITWQLARTWPGGRTRERQLKNQGGATRRCPLCPTIPRKKGTTSS